MYVRSEGCNGVFNKDQIRPGKSKLPFYLRTDASEEKIKIVERHERDRFVSLSTGAVLYVFLFVLTAKDAYSHSLSLSSDEHAAEDGNTSKRVKERSGYGVY